MNETINKSENMLPLSVEAADRLLACTDGESALLYLHILRCGSFSASRAARDLRCTADAVSRAAESLRRLGLLSAPDEPLPREELPEYTGADISERAKSDSAFEGVIFEAQRALGKMLSTNDMRILFGIYDHLGLPAELICLLINHCIEAYQSANGDGRTPTMRYVEKEAWFWARNEITTLDAAEEHIRREKQSQQLTQQVQEVLQIRARALTATEKKYVESWQDMGFSPEVIAVAYDRTVVGTGKLAWKYMDKILRDWQEKGLFTPEEIEQGDARRAPGPAPSAAGKKPAPVSDAAVRGELEKMRKMYESMRKKG